MLIAIPLLLATTTEESARLRLALAACNAAAQAAADHALAHGRPGKYELQDAVYDALKADFGVGAQAAVRAVGKAYDGVRLLSAKQTTIAFRPDGAFPYDHRKMFTAKAGRASLWTQTGRVSLAFSCEPAKLALVEGGRHKQSDLRVDRAGRWWLHLIVETADEPLAEPQGFLGVDLGVANLAVASDGACFGGGEVERLRAKHAKTRRSYQKTNTHKAKRKLRRLGLKQSRFQRQENHRIAKRIVAAAKAQSCGIALEALTGIRGKSGKRTVSRETRARLGNWGFCQLRQFVEYKARRAGVVVEAVSPAYTSQTCSACGSCDEANRPSRDEFHCVGCGHASCADLNAAKNIAARAAQALVARPAGGASKSPREGPSAPAE